MFKECNNYGKKQVIHLLEVLFITSELIMNRNALEQAKAAYITEAKSKCGSAKFTRFFH